MKRRKKVTLSSSFFSKCIIYITLSSWGLGVKLSKFTSLTKFTKIWVAWPFNSSVPDHNFEPESLSPLNHLRVCLYILYIYIYLCMYMFLKIILG